MVTMTAGRAVVRALIDEGIDTVFGIPGAQNLEIYDGLFEYREQIQHIVTRHESGAGFMADGFARASGKVGVSLTIGGPGLTNNSTPLGQAFSDSSPLLVISTQSQTDDIDRDIGAHHQMLDQLGHTSGITAWNRRILDPAEVPRAIHDALDHMRTQRPRPVHIEIPADILTTAADMTFSGRLWSEPYAASDDEIERAVTMLAGARRPLLWIGGGASGAGQIVELAESLQSAVVMTGAGKGIVPEDHPLSLGSNLRSEKMAAFIAAADAVLILGSQLAAQETGGGQLEFPEHTIRVDVDDFAHDSLYEPQLKIRSDAANFVDRIFPRIREKLAAAGGITKTHYCEEISHLKSRLDAEEGLGGEGARDIIGALRSVLPPQGLLACDMTILGYRATTAYPCALPRTFLFPRGFGTLGWALPAAIGARFAMPDRPVVSVCGDGGFLFTAQELATAAMHGLSIVVLVLNNDSYGMVRRFQKMRYGDERVIATDLRNPDFVKFAESFGVYARRLRDTSEVPSALAESLDAGGPTLLELDVDF